MSYELNVIVTAYNNEKYIGKCLLSVIDQWVGDFKLTIAYDEGSTDNTLKICEEFAEGVNFIEIYHKSHCFVGEMRNAVAKDATEKYIMFIDGDDELAPRAIKEMLGEIKRTNADWVGGLMELRYPGGKKKIVAPFKYSKDGQSKICTTSTHPTLFDRHVFLTKLYFRPNIKTHEDRVNAYLTPKYAKTTVVDKITYYYNITPTSLIRNKSGRVYVFEDIICVWRELKLERNLFTDEEWELIEDDLTWSATSALFFLRHVERKDRIKTVKDMTSILNVEFPKWKEHEIITGIRTSNFIVRKYINILFAEKFDESFLKFTSGYKMRILEMGTEIYALGGIKGWMISNLTIRNK